MFENIGHFFKKIVKTEPQKELGSKDAAKERLHLVLMQDRANVSADFLELMKQEIIDVIKKYIVVDEDSIDVRLTNQSNDDGTNGAPSLYANIPIVNIKNDMMAEKIKDFEGVDFNKEMGIPTYNETPNNSEENKEDNKEENKEENEKIPDVIELPESNEYKETAENKENDIKVNENNTEIEEQEEVKEVFVEVDDAEDDENDDDDVTFDDLLKAAEEADKKEEANTKENSTTKEENKNVEETKKAATKDKRKKKK